MRMKKEYQFFDISRFLPYFMLLIVSGLFFLVLYIYKSYLMPFFIASLLYLLMKEVHGAILKKLKKESLSAFLSTFLTVIGILLPGFFLLYNLFEESLEAIEALRKIFTREEFLYWKRKALEIGIPPSIWESIEKNLSKSLDQIGIFLLAQGRNLIEFLGTFLWNFFLSIVILFFLFREAHKLPRVISKYLPFPDEVETKLMKDMVGVLDTVLKGNLLIASLQGFFLGIYFFLFGIPTPILYGVVGSFFALIPVVGTSVLWIPASIYLYFTQGSFFLAFFLGAICLVTYLVLENLVKPLWLDKKLNIHPLFLFLAILGGLESFGIEGVILGPFFVAVFLSVWKMVYFWNKLYGKVD